MNILDKIITDKKREVELKKSIIPVSQLEASVLFNSRTYSLSKLLKNSVSGIIAEHKRRSPSKAVINNNHSVEDVVLGYQNAGACGISVLTDAKYFGGSLEDLLLAKASTNIPLLRKEFIIDEYQILEAKAHGADVILLIAAVLTRKEIKQLSEFAHSLGLEVLLEVHNLEELEKNTNSTVHYFRKLTQLRKSEKVFTYGAFELIDKDNPTIFAYTRTMNEKKVLVVLNFSEKENKFNSYYKINKNKIMLSNYSTPSLNGMLKPYEAVIIDVSEQ